MPYKCVDNEQQSSNVWGKAGLKYSTEEWVTSPDWLSEIGYFPCVFLNLEDAMSFSDFRLRVWECEVDGKIIQGYDLPPLLDTYDLSNGEVSDSHHGWPSGTVMAERVKLTRMVYPLTEEVKENPICIPT